MTPAFAAILFVVGAAPAPPGPAEPSEQIAVTVTVTIGGSQSDRLGRAQRAAYDAALLQAAGRLDPALAALSGKDLEQRMMRLRMFWTRAFVSAEVQELATVDRKLRMRMRCVFRRKVLAAAVQTPRPQRLVLIVGPPEAAAQLEGLIAQRLTTAGIEVLPLAALADPMAGQWRATAQREHAQILMLHAREAKVHHVVLGRLKTTTTGELLAGQPLFTCRATLSWQLIDATTIRIEEVELSRASGNSLGKLGARRKAFEALAGRVAEKVAPHLGPPPPSPRDAENVHLRISDVRFAQVRRLQEELKRLPSVARLVLSYFVQRKALFAVYLKPKVKPGALETDFARMRGVRLTVRERKGNEWTCTVETPPAPPSP
jgi:hypothetical protein